MLRRKSFFISGFLFGERCGETGVPVTLVTFHWDDFGDFGDCGDCGDFGDVRSDNRCDNNLGDDIEDLGVNSSSE